MQNFSFIFAATFCVISCGEYAYLQKYYNETSPTRKCKAVPDKDVCMKAALTAVANKLREEE